MTEKKSSFSFDKVFGPSASQQEIFSEISGLIQSCLDGYNVCVFAYGQTGSGKTHTMEGSLDDIGVIPRALHQIFTSTRSLSEKGWEFTLETCYLEIYNETLRDLLSSEQSKLDIRHSGSKTVVSGATLIAVDSEDQVDVVLKTAASNRAVAATQCNERSSRSHRYLNIKKAYSCSRLRVKTMTS